MAKVAQFNKARQRLKCWKMWLGVFADLALLTVPSSSDADELHLSSGEVVYGKLCGDLGHVSASDICGNPDMRVIVTNDGLRRCVQSSEIMSIVKVPPESKTWQSGGKTGEWGKEEDGLATCTFSPSLAA